MIIVAMVGPRVGLVTLTVIPRSNAANDSKVFGKHVRSAPGPCLSVSKQFGLLRLSGLKNTKMLAKQSFFIAIGPYL